MEADVFQLIGLVLLVGVKKSCLSEGGDLMCYLFKWVVGKAIIDLLEKCIWPETNEATETCLLSQKTTSSSDSISSGLISSQTFVRILNISIKTGISFESIMERINA